MAQHLLVLIVAADGDERAGQRQVYKIYLIKEAVHDEGQ